MKKNKGLAWSRWLVAGLLFSACSVPCFALGASPLGIFFQSVATEATGVWAISGAIVGLAVGIIGCIMGQHQVKAHCTTLVILSAGLLSIQGLIAWLTV